MGFHGILKFSIDFFDKTKKKTLINELLQIVRTVQKRPVYGKY